MLMTMRWSGARARLYQWPWHLQQPQSHNITPATVDSFRWKRMMEVLGMYISTSYYF